MQMLKVGECHFNHSNPACKVAFGSDFSQNSIVVNPLEMSLKHEDLHNKACPQQGGPCQQLDETTLEGTSEVHATGAWPRRQ